MPNPYSRPSEDSCPAGFFPLPTSRRVVLAAPATGLGGAADGLGRRPDAHGPLGARQANGSDAAPALEVGQLLWGLHRGTRGNVARVDRSAQSTSSSTSAGTGWTARQTLSLVCTGRRRLAYRDAAH